MRSYLVLSALGPDRPGLVALIADHVTKSGGNVEESRMAVLGGEFGVMMLVSGSADALGAVERGLPSLGTQTGLGILARATSGETREHGLPCLLVASSLDQEGIVHSVAAALRDLGVNITSMETESYFASMSGQPLFRLEARIDVPRGVGLTTLREKMTAVAKLLDLDLDIKADYGK
jgi:glycine cleavage system transcriptional repressor